MPKSKKQNDNLDRLVGKHVRIRLASAKAWADYSGEVESIINGHLIVLKKGSRELGYGRYDYHWGFKKIVININSCNFVYLEEG